MIDAVLNPQVNSAGESGKEHGPTWIRDFMARVEAARTVDEEYQHTVYAQRCVEACVLADVINSIPEAARVAMSSRIKREVAPGSRNNIRYFEQEGILLLNGPDRVVAIEQSKVVHACEVLVLWADGALADITYTATWTGMNGGLEQIAGAAEELSPLGVVERWEYADCIGALIQRVGEHANARRPVAATSP